jgi:hypothetical protein
LVHWSIKVNLIDALRANVDVFVRTSTEDNVHGAGISSAGLVRQLAPSELDALKKALAVVKPVKVAYISAAEELKESQATFPSASDNSAAGYWHEMFRRYDARRYSMFFNRHQVYKMATDHAAAQGFEYDWFVHARLDCGWVSPVEPISHYSPQRTWLPSTWLENAPDTFALIPNRPVNVGTPEFRQKWKWSDVFFRLEHKIVFGDKTKNNHAFCLGGPDFDTRVCGGYGDVKTLMKNTKSVAYRKNELKLTDGQATDLLLMCCAADPYGHSEAVLRRALSNNEVWTETAPFHVFIARDFNLQAHCEISVGPSKMWRLLNNQKDDVINFSNMSYYVRSIGGLVGCEYMGRGSQCQVSTTTVARNKVSTRVGSKCSNYPRSIRSLTCACYFPRLDPIHQKVTKYDCPQPAPPAVTSPPADPASRLIMLPVMAHLARDPTLCLKATRQAGGRGSLQIAPCTGLKYTLGPPKHWYWHSRDEMFFPFEGPSGRSLKSTLAGGYDTCLVGGKEERGRLPVSFVSGSCPDKKAAKSTVKLLEFELVGFDRSKVFDKTQKAGKKNAHVLRSPASRPPPSLCSTFLASNLCLCLYISAFFCSPSIHLPCQLNSYICSLQDPRWESVPYGHEGCWIPSSARSVCRQDAGKCLSATAIHHILWWRWLGPGVAEPLAVQASRLDGMRKTQLRRHARPHW